jgi:hypothetical protein
MLRTWFLIAILGAAVLPLRADSAADLASADKALDAEDWAKARDAYQAVLTEQPGSLAALGGLGQALYRLGKDSDCVKQLEAAVAVKLGPAASLDEHRRLARARHYLALGYRRMDRSAAARQVLEASLKELRALAHPNGAPEDLAELADTLDDYGAVQRDQHHNDEALKYTLAGVAELKPAASSSPHNSHLYALLMDSLSNRYAALDKGAESLAVSQQSLELWRQLAAKDPKHYEGDLADSLSSLARRYGAIGQPREALKPGEEAVALDRRLEKEEPGSRQSDLAGALSELADYYNDIEMDDKALPLAAESVQIYVELGQKSPDRYAEDLASALNTYGVLLREAGRTGEAVDALTQSLNLRQALLQGGRDDLLPDVGGSTSNLANALREDGQAAKAVQSSEDAVKIFQRLDAAEPGPWALNLSKAQDSLGDQYMAVGRTKEAISAYSAALEQRRRELPKGRLSDRLAVAGYLEDYSKALETNGQLAECLAPGRESVSVLRVCAKEDPDLATLPLARTLNNLALRLVQGKHLAEARKCSEESVNIFRAQFALKAEENNAGLRKALSTLADILDEAGEHADSSKLHEEIQKLESQEKKDRSKPEA